MDKSTAISAAIDIASRIKTEFEQSEGNLRDVLLLSSDIVESLSGIQGHPSQKLPNFSNALYKDILKWEGQLGNVLSRQISIGQTRIGSPERAMWFYSVKDELAVLRQTIHTRYQMLQFAFAECTVRVGTATDQQMITLTKEQVVVNQKLQLVIDDRVPGSNPLRRVTLDRIKELNRNYFGNEIFREILGRLQSGKRISCIHSAKDLLRLFLALKDNCMYDEAHIILDWATSICRDLANTGSMKARFDIARAIYEMLSGLESCWVPEDAPGIMAQAVEARRQLGGRDHHAYLTRLVPYVKKFAGRIRTPELLRACIGSWQEVVDIWRILTKGDRETQAPLLAEFLHKFVCVLGSIDLHEDAVKAGEESIEIYRELVITDRDTYISSLARGLHCLAEDFGELARYSDAERAEEEAVEIYRHGDNYHLDECLRYLKRWRTKAGKVDTTTP